jgi:hypothetical protein
MEKKFRSFVSALALAFAVLFFGPATSKAYAGHLAPYPHAKHFCHGYRHAAPYYARPYFYPRRYARVFVYAPYPHWIYRPVAYPPAAYYPPAPYCAPY